MQNNIRPELQRSIIDSIIDLQYSLMYTYNAAQEKNKAKDAFWKHVYELYQKDTDAFTKATDDIIENKCDYLNTEEALIRLECIGIFGKVPFYAWIFRLRAKLNIDITKTASMLKSTLSQIRKRNDATAKFDIWTFNELLDDLASNSIYSEAAVERMLSVFDAAEIIDTEGAIAFVAIQSARNNKNIPRKISDVALIGRELAIISLDGLAAWYAQNGRSTVQKLKTALSNIGAKETANIFAKLSTVKQSDANSLNEKLYALETELFDMFGKEDHDMLSRQYLINS